MGLMLTINGAQETLPQLAPGSSLTEVLGALRLKADRVAVERNGVIEARTRWDAVMIAEGDRLEIVHFVGGG